MPLLPVWSRLKAVAHTRPYDAAIVGDYQTVSRFRPTVGRPSRLPTLVVVGGKSPAWLHHGTQALADALPTAEHRVLDGQTHNVKAKALAPLLAEFFAREATPTDELAGAT